MFTEIIKIKNIGSFSDFPNRISLGKNNIFYALNSHGKTTFTSILDSIKENNVTSLYGRKTLKSTSELECIIKRGTDVYKIDNKKWNIGASELNSQDENIIIFDDNYISKNFFSEKIEREHEKNMHTIIFGKRGVDLNTNIKDLNSARKIKKDLLDKIVSSLITKSFTTEDYLKIDISLLNQVQLNNDLININKQIQNIEQQVTIKSKSNLDKLDFFNYDLQEISDKFYNSKINSKSHEFAKNKVFEYKKSRFHNHEDADNFIKYGIQNIVDQICPFCHQNLEEKEDLMDIYKNYFDESYKNYFDEFKNLFTIYDDYNFAADIQKLSGIYKTNQTLYNDSWKNNISSIPELYVFPKINEDLVKINNYKKIVIGDLKNKIQDLNSDFNNINIVEQYRLISEINTIIKDYNENIDIINIKIDEFKKSLQAGDLISLKKEKNRLEDLINRLTESEKLKVSNHKKVSSEISSIDIEIQRKKEELVTYTDTIRADYLSLINQKLIDIGIHHFNIGEIEPKTHVNGAYVEIGLLLDNSRVDLKNYNDSVPTFKNTLSRGDRNSLAFAFFLAYIERISNKQDLILVFDDPLSSHDDNRQDATALEIKKLGNSVKQLIILTHKKDFFAALNKKFKGDSEYFEIKKNHLGSYIDLLNPDILLENQIQKIINEFEKYIKGISTDLRPDNLLNDLRKLFEGILRVKYHLRTRSVKTIMQYDKLTDIFFSQGLLLDIKDDLIDLAQISNDGSHIGYDSLNAEELKTKLIKSLSLIEKI